MRIGSSAVESLILSGPADLICESSFLGFLKPRPKLTFVSDNRYSSYRRHILTAYP